MIRAIRLLLPAFLVLCSLAPTLHAENRFQAELRTEGNHLALCKQLPKIASCAETLFTGQPFHIAVGSLAPQNGIGIGIAFVEHWHPTYCPAWINFTAPPPPGTKTDCNWRATFNADAVATPNGSWRAGGYFKAYRLPAGFDVRSAPVVSLYAQTTSLNRIYFYGIGPNTLPSQRTAFGFTESVLGTQITLPISRVPISLLAEINGRLPSVRGDHSETVPSIEQRFTDASAPGLSRQPAFIQFGQGVRLTPHYFTNRFRLNYLLQFQQFIAPSTSTNSFRRFTADLDHEFQIYRRSLPNPITQNDRTGPDACSSDSGDCPHVCLRLRETFTPHRPLTPDERCPPLGAVLNKEGSIGIRLLMTGSIANAGSVVPFYFDPTMGGSDLNGQPILASYPDYRFRAPNLLLLRGTFEHSLGKLPAGFLFSVDEGKIGMNRDDISFDHLRHTFTAGLTLHAGGLPVVYVLFSWGGNEGHHTTATISNTLLGASARPSLF